MEQTTPVPAFAWRAALLLAALKLALHLAAAGHYGYFRDELYFLDCARHLQWGYVDDAPGVVLAARMALLLGGSLPAVRLLAALGGAGTVFLGCLAARELGGGRFAQVLAGLCLLGAPAFLVMQGMLCVGAFEPLSWLGCALLALRLRRGGDPRLWLAFGAVAGLGVQLKYTMGLVLVCLLIAMLLSPLRRELRKPWFWAGATLALLILLPTLLWQVNHDWPLVTALANIRRTGKNVVVGPLAFLGLQVMLVNPALAPVWLAGLARLLRRPETRFLGVFHLLLLGAMLALQAKDYYLAAAYPLLFGAGGAAVEAFLRPGWRWARGAVLGLADALVLLMVPAFVPLLPPAQLLAWQARLGIRPPKQETSFDGPLMQPLGDQFGWPELAGEVARIYHSLDPAERRGTGIYAGNYGEAGAINRFGPELGLPPAICAHQAHSLWGPPAMEPATLIWLGGDRAELEAAFASVTPAAVHRHPWGMAEENRPIYLCRGPKRSLRQRWDELRHWN